MEFDHIQPLVGMKNLVHYSLKPLATKPTTHHHQLISDLDGLVAQAASQDRQKLEQIVLFQNNVSSTQVYARFRGEFIDLAQELIRYATPTQLATVGDAEPASVLAARQVYHAIEGLLEFIEMRFAPSEPVDTYLAECYRRIVQAKLAHRFTTIMDDLKAHGADPTLLTILQAPYDQARNDNNGNFLTYHKARYLLSLKQALDQLLQTKHRDLTSTVMDLLLTFDFNSPAFLRYCNKDIDLALNLHEKNVDQLYCLQGYHRRIQRAMPVPGMRLMEKQESLLTRLSAIIVDEKACIDAGKGGNRAARIRPVTEPLPEERSKLHVPTEIIACLIDAFESTNKGVVNRSQIFRFFAGIFRSDTDQPISNKYFRKASYGEEERVKAESLSLLKTMMEHIQGDS
jgi:hypothetical protein